MLNSKRFIGLVAFAIALLILSGCATYQPRPLEGLPATERSQTQTKDDIGVTAVVLSAKESEAAFDIPLYQRDIQPIWLKVENKTNHSVWFLPTSVDPNYLAPLEVAYMHHATFSSRYNDRMDQYLHEQSMGRYVEPNSVRSGFVFTNLHEGTKIFNVDIVGQESGSLTTFTFVIPVPGLTPDYKNVDFKNLYTKNEINHYDENGLRKALDDLPCCTTNADGSKQGDPLNLVIVGEGEDVEYALLSSNWKPMISPAYTVNKSPSRSELVSLHYLYGRAQDATFHKLRARGDERNRLRLWLSPMNVEGKPVWIGHIGQNIAPGSKRNRPASYRLGPDVDDARDYLIQDLLYSQNVLKFGDIRGFEAAPISEPRQNFKGAIYFTDGYRTVLWLSRDPVDFEEVGYLGWDDPPIK